MEPVKVYICEDEFIGEGQEGTYIDDCQLHWVSNTLLEVLFSCTIYSIFSFQLIFSVLNNFVHTIVWVLPN